MDSKGHHTTKFKHRDYWSEVVINTSFIGVQIFESHNAPSYALMFTIFIIFHCGYGHWGENQADDVLDFRIFGFRDRCPFREISETNVFFIITLPPDILVRSIKFVHVK